MLTLVVEKRLLLAIHGQIKHLNYFVRLVSLSNLYGAAFILDTIWGQRWMITYMLSERRITLLVCLKHMGVEAIHRFRQQRAFYMGCRRPIKYFLERMSYLGQGMLSKDLVKSVTK